MQIEYKSGNLLHEDVEALVNAVNCVGVIGKGIALQFKKVWPDNFQAYAIACRRQEVQPGTMFVFETRRLTNPHYIINFPTKRHWQGQSRVEDIEAGLKSLVAEVRQRNIASIAIPPLGSGLGGLAWSQIRPLIESAVQSLDDVRVIVYEPLPGEKSIAHVRSSSVPRMTPARAALVGLMERYLAGLLDPFITLLELHKLMYFMQEAGEPLQLRFARGPYGPYAENLRHLLHQIEGYYISGYGTGGDSPDKPLELVPGAVRDARAALDENSACLERFNRVVSLVEGFESPFGLELLATVHWILRHEAPDTLEALVERTYAWAPRKSRFSQYQIGLAHRVLLEKGWVPSGTSSPTRAPKDAPGEAGTHPA